MYTVYDFINSKIDSKRMKFGWMVEIVPQTALSCSEIVMRYTMLNFDWTSLEYLNDEVFNMYLLSESYKEYKEKMERAKDRYNRLYFTALSIEHLKSLVEQQKLKVNVDNLIDKAVKRKSEKIREKISKQKSLQEN